MKKTIKSFEELYKAVERGEIANAYTDVTLFGRKRPKVVIKTNNDRYDITEQNFEDYRKYL